MSESSEFRCSIVVPCSEEYRRRYLSDCLESVLPQLVRHELIVETFDPIRERFTDCLNRGIERAQAEYILPLGADDILAPGSLTSYAEVVDDHHDVFYGNLQCFGDSVHRVLRRNAAIRFSDFAEENQLFWSSLFRKSAWLKVGGYWSPPDGLIYEDWDFWMRLMKAGCRFRYIDRVMFHYRVHDDQGSVKMAEHWEKIRNLIRSRM